jgi:mono/diheme cytochrome c family protein
VRALRALLLLAVAASAACRDHRLPVVDGSNRDLAAGKIIYERKCASCHGPTGDGNTITASRHRFANLIDGVWRSDGSLEALERQIRFGRDPMPRFQGKLTDEEIRQTAAFVMELSRVAGAGGTGEGSSR